MSDEGNETTADAATSTDGDDGPPVEERRVERTFTCTVCGYPTAREVGLLRSAVSGTCDNCGDWTLQFADESAVVDGAREAAGALAGETLTERQALAHLLRGVLGFERGPAAEAMDASPSNLDNLGRRAREKLDDARHTLDALDDLRADAGAPDDAASDEGAAGEVADADERDEDGAGDPDAW